VANRLQAALWRGAFYLVSQGIASISDVDTAIAHGPGLRWALLGPFLIFTFPAAPAASLMCWNISVRRWKAGGTIWVPWR
jgi:hypothetical protein